MGTLVGVLVVAACATVGDFIWYTYGVQHTTLAGLLHGALLLTAVGGVLGASSGRFVRGLPLGTLAGIGGAATYYLLVALTGGRTYGASIPASWVTMWLILAALEGRWLRAPLRRTWSAIAWRGTVAAVLGGIAFYLVMNVLWGRPPVEGRNYLVQFLAWAFAWAPGLLVLTMGRKPASASGAVQSPSAASRMEAKGAVEVERSITSAELLTRRARGEMLHVLDVRSEGEFAEGHVPGAVNIPFTYVPVRLDAVPGASEDELILYCGHGPRAYIAAAALRVGGRSRIVYLSGHWAAWERAGLPVER